MNNIEIINDKDYKFEFDIVDDYMIEFLKLSILVSSQLIIPYNIYTYHKDKKIYIEVYIPNDEIINYDAINEFYLDIEESVELYNYNLNN